MDLVERSLRTFSILACMFVLVGWALFAIDETRAASQTTATEVAGRDAARTADPTPEQERAREAAHSSVREFVDDVDDVLVAPFAGLTSGHSSQWARRTVPALIALLFYGAGIGFLARFAHGRSHGPQLRST